MPIEYSVSDDGHFISAKAINPVTSDEFVEYEVSHATDERIRPPISEILEIEAGSLDTITKDSVSNVIARREELTVKHSRHRCGVVVPYSDDHAWDLTKFYEAMTILHTPEVVIVFGNQELARHWLGFESK